MRELLRRRRTGPGFGRNRDPGSATRHDVLRRARDKGPTECSATSLNRILLMIPTLIGVAVLVFFMLRVMPGDIVEVKLRGDGGNVTQEAIETERARLGLDKPLLGAVRRLDGRPGDARFRHARCGPAGR